MLRIATDANKNRLLDAIATTGNLKRACEQTGISAANHYSWLKRDPAYAAAYEDAAMEAADLLEAEAFRRGHDGVDEPIFYQGEECGTVRKYSDGLLTLLLKARRPTVFGDKIKQEITGKDGEPLNGYDLTKLPAEKLEALKQILREAASNEPDADPGAR
jgi:hypothetical protein